METGDGGENRISGVGPGRDWAYRKIAPESSCGLEQRGARLLEQPGLKQWARAIGGPGTRRRADSGLCCRLPRRKRRTNRGNCPQHCCGGNRRQLHLGRNGKGATPLVATGMRMIVVFARLVTAPMRMIMNRVTRSSGMGEHRMRAARTSQRRPVRVIQPLARQDLRRMSVMHTTPPHRVNRKRDQGDQRCCAMQKHSFSPNDPKGRIKPPRGPQEV